MHNRCAIAENRVHTGTSHNIEVPVGRWINMYNLYQLPTGVELWTNFELQCGRPGILDLNSTVAVIGQSAPIRSECVQSVRTRLLQLRLL